MSAREVPTCVASVREPGGWHSHTCGRKASVNEMGEWWCKTHAPSIVAAKQEVRAAAFRVKMDQRVADRQAVDEAVALRAELLALRTALVKWVYADDGFAGNREDSNLRALIPADDWGITS